MNKKASRLEALKMIISSKELCSQEEVLNELAKEGIIITQATLSRYLKQLRVAKASSMNGSYVYVLPNETMYKRQSKPMTATEMIQSSGFVSVNASGNIVVVKTRPGYASALAYNIDSNEMPEIIGTIAGDDTIFMVIREDVNRDEFIKKLKIGK